jgi:spore coat polysaccharide biosynthesis protein SpsF
LADPARTVAIIQARMGATRLPGKVLLDIGGQPMLARVVERVRRARRVDLVVVATTVEVQDDPVAQECARRGYACARGSLHDVLDRYVQAARLFEAGVIVRVTADCPVIDPQLVDLCVDEFRKAGADFAATRLPPPWPRTYPIGEDVEVVGRAALERAWAEADRPHQREHVMPFFYEGLPTVPVAAPVAQLESPRGFRLVLLNHAPDCGAQRWTVDTPEDLELMRQVYARFKNRDGFGWTEVLALFEREPGLAKINASVPQKSGLEAENHSK